MSNETSDKRRIWDLPTRVFHWTLALSFFGAYLLAESERVRHIHVMFGYTVLALVVFRLLWGVFGTPYARFRSFAFGPRAALAHVKGLAHRDVPEHAGHTPAGSWAIWAMLALALTTAVTGWLHLNEIGGEALEEVHEVAANVWLLVVFVHVAGVIVSSLVERRNLVRSMVSGYKTLNAGGESVRNAPVLGALLIAGVATFWIATMLSGGALVLPEEAASEEARSAQRLSSHGHSADD